MSDTSEEIITVHAHDRPKSKEGTDAKDTQSSAFKSFLSGGFGGVCAVLVGEFAEVDEGRVETDSRG
jgi:hypothetical protein